ncbi:MAG: hypothetical protein COA79_10945 [Planctomycetota bacterium]|nr:MAG: hypothetical protein COA79_10945 [Planctomycetota bacterium]
MSELKIIKFEDQYEQEWVALRARVVARSKSWDFVERKKIQYDNDSIELLLLDESKIIGYIDVEMESSPGKICWNNHSIGGVVQEFGIDPKFQNNGYGKKLLKEIKSRLLEKNINRLELWTKDPKSALIYKHFKFEQIFIHQHYRKSLQEEEGLKELFSGLVSTSYGYFISDDLSMTGDDFEPPLGAHLGIGFEWDFIKSKFLN